MAWGGGCGAASDGGRAYHLPSGVHNPRKRPFTSGPTSPPLPGKILPLDVPTEKELITTLLEEISMLYGIDLEKTPSLECRLLTPVENEGEGRLVIVGASHMCRTAEYLNSECISLAYPGFKLEKEKSRILQTA